MDLLHPALVPAGSRRVAWLLQEPEADPRTRAGRHRRQRRRLTRTTKGTRRTRRDHG